VLFPIDPGDDAFVEGDATYQLRDRAGRAGVVRSRFSGSGLVIAALARGPLDLESLVRNGRWDAALKIDDNQDLEDGLVQLAERVAGGPVDYDAAGFSIVDYDDAPLVARRGPAYPLGLGYGWGVGGWGAPLFYDPFYGWGYSPWAWGYGGRYGYGYGGYGYGGYGGYGRGPIIVVPSGPRTPGYEIKGRSRSWNRGSVPAADRRGSGSNGRSAAPPRASQPAPRESGRSSGSQPRQGRSWSGGSQPRR
jgi:hypothetical protein